jgi:hypothetical protein
MSLGDRVEREYQNEGCIVNAGGSFRFKRCGLSASTESVTVRFLESAVERTASMDLQQAGATADIHGLVHSAETGGLRIESRLRVPAEGSHAEWDIHVTSLLPGPVSVRQVEILLAVEPLDPGTHDPSTMCWFRNGWQSWGASQVVSAASPTLSSPVQGILYRIKEDPAVPRRESACVSDMVTAIKIGDEALLVGSGRLERFQSIRIAARDKSFRLALMADVDGLPLAPGSSARIASWQLEGEHTITVLLDWWGRRMALRRKPVSWASSGRLVGWCSWYEAKRGVTAAYVRRTLDVLRTTPGMEPVKIVVLDDGYQAAVGDWLAPRKAFGGTVRETAAAVQAAGRVPGIWLAPFVAQRGSALLADHPDWFLRDGRGLMAAGFNPMWRARFHPLDVGHPDVLGWLSDLFRSLARMGFRLFKLDFLYPAAFPASGSCRTSGRFSAFRNALRVIREAVGDDAYLLGCGCPLAPAAGVVDGMRVSSDVEFSWDSSGLLSLATGDTELAGVFPAVRNTWARFPFARHLFSVDPDCLLVRQRNGRLSPQELALYGNTVSLTGDLVLIGDDITRWRPADFASFAARHADLPDSVEPLYTSDETSPLFCLSTRRGLSRLTLLNLGDGQRMMSLCSERFGTGVRVRSATGLGDAAVGLEPERVSFSHVPRHASLEAAIEFEPGEGDP